MKKFNIQMFAEPYDGITSPKVNAISGKDILLCVWDSTGENLLALGGQQDSNVDQEAEVSEVSSKSETADGDWSVSVSGTKSWSGEVNGIYLATDSAQSVLKEAFREGTPVCLKWINKKLKKGIYAGFAYITSISFEAPVDDIVTTSFSFTGNGKLVDLASDPMSTDTMPQGVSAAGTESLNTDADNTSEMGGSES